MFCAGGPYEKMKQNREKAKYLHFGISIWSWPIELSGGNSLPNIIFLTFLPEEIESIFVEDQKMINLWATTHKVFLGFI